MRYVRPATGHLADRPGDERPCARCIKRGLQSQCADGVRKKAKYLHDAPPEALIPPSMGGTYTLNNARTGIAQPPVAPPTTLPQQNNYFAPAQPPALQIYPPAPNQPQMQPQIQSATASFASQTPISPQFNTTPQLPSTQPGPTTPNMQYAFDPSDPAFFNFDLASFNFGNQYGALEFGMLHHMSSGAHEVGGPDLTTPINQVHPYGINYPDNNALLFGQDAMMNVDFNNSQRGSQSMPTPHNTPIIQSVDRTDLANGPYAIAIGDRPSSLTSGSPVSITHDVKPAMDGPGSPALIVPQLAHATHPHAVQHPHQKHAEGSSPLGGHGHHAARKRPHDADWIYETVKKPYSYTSGFHRLLTYIKTHFTKNNLSRITQSIAVIRPALLTFAQRLTERDLVFMEVSVQRTLFEYDDFIRATGTPTVVMRRDGTVLAVSTEFTLMTGWSKAVLLGKKPNRNVNRGGGSGSGGGPPAAGDAAAKAAQRAEEAKGAPPQQQQVNGSAGHQGVLIAEILDQETVVEFYEDYARLAFGDPAGRAVRRGRLLKYREGPPPPHHQQQDGGGALPPAPHARVASPRPPPAPRAATSSRRSRRSRARRRPAPRRRPARAAATSSRARTPSTSSARARASSTACTAGWCGGTTSRCRS